MHPILNIATRAVRKAGDYIIKNYEFHQNITSIQNKNNNFITKIDHNVEKILIEIIHKSYPYHTIITKKGNKILGKNNDIQWIINPLSDGINFIKRFPHFSISIAVLIKNIITHNKKYTEVAVVYDPISNELFSATRGHGAQLNNYRLRMTEQHILNTSIIALNFPFKNKNFSDLFIKTLNLIIKNCANFRNTGSTSLDLCYVAANRVDAFYGINLNTCDFLCGDLIIREAGGIINNFIINDKSIFLNIFIAGDLHIVKDILNILKKYLHSNKLFI
ncbi:Inositol-1-monophosphatase [Candidatus Providencia siddallii]|uniref:Inositol-1-monophosphatase n=1 Tax=Candidatus Providencia siddallii TaxID=1715285 RepID=A0A0M6W7Z8_9GAMM|nr:Inositol-1-monophosphatase [Candidatus Providencia siddallii]